MNKISLYKLVNCIFSLFPIKKKKIFFLSYYGNQYGCNPKYLSEYFVDNFPEWDIVWGFTNPEKYNISGIRSVKFLSIRYFYELCTSAVFITNYIMPETFTKRKNQLYIQTWHSSLRLKMIEKDAESTLPENYIKMAKRDSAQVSALLSGCKYSSQIFERCFWSDVQIIPTGTPRNDLLFKDDIQLKAKIKKILGIGQTSNVLLYAPTFRKDNSLKYYDICFSQLKESLESKWQGKWTIVLRLHPHLKEFSTALTKNDSEIIDATNYDDIQELLYIADSVISDYSSLIFDFSLTKRPCILYAPDKDEYISKDRKLYFNLSELPFPICMNNEQLCNCISEFNLVTYQNRINEFITKIGTFETGQSCENVAKYIIENQ